LFERALALDPQSVAAQSYLATALTARVEDNLTDSAVADFARPEALAAQALSTSPGSSLAHYAKGQVLRGQYRYSEAIHEYETVLALNRNWVQAYAHIGQCKLYTGSIEEVIALQGQSIRLSPRDPVIGVFYNRIGLVHLLQSRTDEAIIWLEKARNAMPAHPLIRANLASAYALKGETERAAAELAEARRLSGDDRFSSITRLKAADYFVVPKIRALFEATYFRRSAQGRNAGGMTAVRSAAPRRVDAPVLPFPRRGELQPVHREKDLDSARIGCSSARRTARFRCQYGAHQPPGPATARRGIRFLPPLSLASSKTAGLRPNRCGRQANSQRKVGANARSARRPRRLGTDCRPWNDKRKPCRSTRPRYRFPSRRERMARPRGDSAISPSQVVIDYCNAWFTEVEAVGFVTGVYVGANAILSGDELFWRLKTKHYWHSLSRVPDIPHRGYQMFQSAVRHPLAAVDIDRNVTMNDAFGDSVLWLAPD
jgi:tetratricopeptide (TPR) repeat protein